VYIYRLITTHTWLHIHMHTHLNILYIYVYVYVHMCRFTATHTGPCKSVDRHAYVHAHFFQLPPPTDPVTSTHTRTHMHITHAHCFRSHTCALTYTKIDACMRECVYTNNDPFCLVLFALVNLHVCECVTYVCECVICEYTNI